MHIANSSVQISLQVSHYPSSNTLSIQFELNGFLVENYLVRAYTETKFGTEVFVVFTCYWRPHSVCLLINSIPLLCAVLQATTAHASLHCTLHATRSECTALPVIHTATLHLSASSFEIHAQYEACHSIRRVHIKGRVLQAVSTDNIQEYELLGETYQPVTDFIPFPRTIAYMVLDTSSGSGTFTDIWSAQRLPRHSTPALLTLPINCQE